MCAIVYWNGIVSNNQTVGKLNHLAHLIPASALFCAFCSNSYCEPNGYWVRFKHKHSLFRALQLLIQHRGVVPFFSLTGILIPGKSWEGSWSMLNKELSEACATNTNENSICSYSLHRKALPIAASSDRHVWWWWAVTKPRQRPEAPINHKYINQDTTIISLPWNKM